MIEMVGSLAKAGADSIGLSDKTGYANPEQVKHMFRRLSREIGASMMAGAHLHNTRGQGLANVVAALEVDVTSSIPRWADWEAAPMRQEPPATL